MNFKVLSGSSSWLAIVGASFFWSWMDRAMFGDSLYFALAPLDGNLSFSSELAQSSFIVMLAASTAAFIGFAALGKRRETSVWDVKPTVAAAALGFVGTVAILLSASVGLTAPTLAGALVSGLAMAAFNMSWGRICVAQGPVKAMTHISGAWALGLVINILTEGLVPGAEGVFVAILPLLSCALYVLDARLQRVELYRIDEAAPAPERIRPAARQVLGVDVRFPLFILVFCIAFGLMCSFEIFTPSEGAPNSVIDIVGLRGIVSLVFFVAGLTALARHMETLFNACLSFMVFGLLAMTVGLYTNDLQGLTRVFIPIGYAGFDILVWTLIAFYAATTRTSRLRIVAVAMGAEQAGILAGQLIGIALGGSANATNNAVLMVLSYLLLIAVMGLARLCTVLWRRHRADEPRALSTVDEEGGNAACMSGGPEADGEAETVAVPTEPDNHLGRFSDAYGLTNRERDIFALFAEGRSAPYIAEMLVLSENTVKTHLRHIYTKCNLHNRQELLDAIEKFKE